VLDPYVEEAADPIGVARRLEGDRRLVVGRASPRVDDDPAVGELDVGRLWREDHPAAQYFRVEARGAGDVVRHDEVGQHNSLWLAGEPGHVFPHWSERGASPSSPASLRGALLGRAVIA